MKDYTITFRLDHKLYIELLDGYLENGGTQGISFSEFIRRKLKKGGKENESIKTN